MRYKIIYYLPTNVPELYFFCFLLPVMRISEPVKTGVVLSVPRFALYSFIITAPAAFIFAASSAGSRQFCLK